MNFLTFSAPCGQFAVTLRVIYMDVVYFRKFARSKLGAVEKLKNRFNFSSQGLGHPQSIQLIYLGLTFAVFCGKLGAAEKLKKRFNFSSQEVGRAQ